LTRKNEDAVKAIWKEMTEPHHHFSRDHGFAQLLKESANHNDRQSDGDVEVFWENHYCSSCASQTVAPRPDCPGNVQNKKGSTLPLANLGSTMNAP
jgi:hypothetical protein